ncbi:DUF929 domain-containing protein [Metallosphaera tengchongensis]|uniref:DUF929 domain-containing protein n=1 Tax=Metallosphaera tengchongensis TaxID=1532350 RepID=A0A6N0NUN1_9CREN|nr:DUF929 domain-containing protein [Metallosphaera tengchongensis]QKQ99187.1 DUF929 domain-containing protein [Metallosphaera tengchongensis]
MPKKSGSKNESRLIYIPFIALALVIILFVALSMRPSDVSQQTQSAFTNLVKVSSTDYASSGKVEVYFVSWYGCPYGATLSWPLYVSLEHYGVVGVTPHTSLTEPGLSSYPIPGLIFQNFTPSSNLDFHFYYIYNQYLNETVSGQPLDGKGVQLGLQELSQEAPNWLVNLISEYQLNRTLVALPNGSQAPIAFASETPHLVTTLVITGPGGTWILLGYPSSFTPQDAVSISTDPSVILSEINSGTVPSQIQVTAQQLLQVIQQAS